MKALDKVPHNRFFTQNLRQYWSSGRTFTWIKNSLNNRKQYVQVNGSRYQWRGVTSGISQGSRSELCPIPFVIFINDLPKGVISDVFMFADDTKIIGQLKKYDGLWNYSSWFRLFEWSNTWLLKFHSNKCKVLQILNKNTSQETATFQMNSYEGGHTSLETINSEKNVGVTIDENLDFAKHIQSQANMANQIVSLTRRSVV